MAYSPGPGLFDDLPANAAAWGLILADNVHLRVGNRPPVLGKSYAMIELAALLDHMGIFGAGYRAVMQIGETLVVESTFQFRLEASFTEVPCVLVARSERGLMSDMRFYLDPSPRWPSEPGIQ